MSAPKTPKVNRKKQIQEEKEKQRKAEQRARADLRNRGGVAANILAGARPGSTMGGASGGMSTVLGSGTDALFNG